jgi:transcriptional regulator with XRE-family HTH domain
MAKQSALPLGKSLRELLSARGMSLRDLAAEVGVNQSHLSRILGARPARSVSGDLAGRIAIVLGLPIDYFPEYREAEVVAAVLHDPELRERIYRQLSRAR